MIPVSPEGDELLVNLAGGVMNVLTAPCECGKCDGYAVTDTAQSYVLEFITTFYYGGREVTREAAQHDVNVRVLWDTDFNITSTNVIIVNEPFMS